ncbi:Dihydrofolate reductase [Streptomyces sp. DvalAA-14]|uniref:dihydrofolate reductase family protein n=1 Tax=unclassified Streptomyces TaxID=2593676 RepID=UPI00081B7F6F|nr:MULTISPECIES: dihydrofolate reductase family protein [unclassified Streptomyces]MYS20728.1 dihydrofolate reductase [Streptomyces sp. SID4948]SCD75751.1 Dihydrofolate reductase [Streptomyces sp. DvalAA-14]
MRKLVVVEFLTADGVMEAPNEWHNQYFDEDMARAVTARMQASDALLLGRTTYEGFAAAWPAMAGEPGADFMNSVAKYVVSSTLDKAEWNNSTVVSEDPAGAIARLKEEPGGDITVMGSATLVHWLLAQGGLVDEIALLIDPVVVGRGKRLFQEGLPTIPLRLVASETFGSGVQHVVYAPQRP